MSWGCTPSVSLVNEWTGGFATNIKIPDWIEGNTVTLKLKGITKLKDCYNGVEAFWGDAGGRSMIFFVRLGRNPDGAQKNTFTCTLDGTFQREGHDITYHGTNCFAAPPPPPANFLPCNDFSFEWYGEAPFRRGLVVAKSDGAWYQGRVVRLDFSEAAEEEGDPNSALVASMRKPGTAASKLDIDQVWNGRYTTDESQRFIEIELKAKPAKVQGVYRGGRSEKYVCINVDHRTFPHVTHPEVLCEGEWPPPLPSSPSPLSPPYQPHQPHHPPSPPVPHPEPPPAPQPWRPPPRPPALPPFPPAHAFALDSWWNSPPPPPPPPPHRKHSKHQHKNEPVVALEEKEITIFGRKIPRNVVTAGIWGGGAVAVVVLVLCMGSVGYLQDARHTGRNFAHLEKAATQKIPQADECDSAEPWQGGGVRRKAAVLSRKKARDTPRPGKKPRRPKDSDGPSATVLNV